MPTTASGPRGHSTATSPTGVRARTRTRLHQRVALIEQMATEWQCVGRSPAAVRAVQAVACRDPQLAELVLENEGRPAPCPTPFDVVAHMRRATGRSQREEAAHLVRVLLREADADPFLSRMLVQALVPGLVSVAAKLRWGQGGEWQDPSEFFAELISTTWVVIRDWSGQDRPYAVLDLLSAIRCRLRRQLFRAKDQRTRVAGSPLLEADDQPARSESDLDRFAAMLLDLHRQGMRTDDVQVLYAHHVLGYSIAELSAMTGRDRRALYARRDRGRERLSV